MFLIGAPTIDRAGRVLVVSSQMEGGASVIAEARINHTPVIASRISGNRGMLGDDYPGLYSFGKTGELRDMLLKFEAEPAFARKLASLCANRASNHARSTEKRNWRKLLAELG